MNKTYSLDRVNTLRKDIESCEVELDIARHYLNSLTKDTESDQDMIDREINSTEEEIIKIDYSLNKLYAELLVLEDELEN